MLGNADLWKKASPSAVISGSEHEIADSSDSEDVIDEGDFHLDLTARKVTVRGRALRLSEPEFDVLVYILSHRKRLVTSHTRLATKAMERGVRQAPFLPVLLSLRRKLNDEFPGVPYIDTEGWILFEFHPGASR